MVNRARTPLISAVVSRRSEYLEALHSRSEIREIHPDAKIGDEELLAAIGYKQELRRHYSSLQVFGISFLIMGLLP